MPLDLAGTLLEAGAVSAEQMERALAHQRQMGGALDTALLELGLVPREDLATHLSRASGLPPAPEGEIEPDPRARRVFPSRVAERHGLAPSRLEGKELSLFATYPVDLAALDEISFMLSLRLVPYIAPEWRVRALLAKVYGSALPDRFAALAEPASELPGATEEPAPPVLEEPTAAGESPPEPPPAPPAHSLAGASGAAASPSSDSGASPPNPQIETATVETATAMDSLAADDDDLDIWIEEDLSIEGGDEEPAVPAAVAAVPEAAAGSHFAPASEALAEAETSTSPEPSEAPPRWDRKQALSALDAARSRDEVVTVALRYLRDFFEGAAVFAVSRNRLAGHDAMGWTGARELCRRIRLQPRDVPMFAAVLGTKAPFLGPVAPERGNAELLAALGRRSPRLALAYPVLLRERPVCVLYADNGERPVSPRRLGDLLLVMGSLPGALERVLRDAKRSRGQTATAAAPPAAPPSSTSEALPPIPTAPPPNPPAAISAEPVPAVPAPVPEELAVPSPFDMAEAVRRLCLAPAASDARTLLLAQIVRRGPAAAAALRDVFPGPIDPACGGEELAVEERGPVLAALHALGTVAAPFLVGLLADPAHERRRWAALLLGRIGDPAAFLPLAETALSGDPELSAAALAALRGVRRHPDFRPVLERLRRELAVADADRPPRAAHALGALGDAEAVPLLVQTLETAGPVAEASAQALTVLTARRFGHDTAAWISWWKAHRSARRSDWLFESLVDPDPEVRSAAASALRRACPRPPLDYQSDASPREREDAARAWRAWWEEQRLEA